jgi:HK97 family phage major capsid protein
MAVTNSALAAAWTPNEWGALVDNVLKDYAVAFKVGTVIPIAKDAIHFPILTGDPTVAWYAENSAISLSDPATAQLIVTPKKVGGGTQIGNETVEDSTPAVDNQVGVSLARAVGKEVDRTFFANTTSNGPSGLQSLTGINVIDTTDYPLTTQDAFIAAKYAALADGAELSVFVMAPDVAQTLELVKEESGSNKNLFEGLGNGGTLAGIPTIISPAVAAGNVWGLDSSQVFVVQRMGTRVEKSKESAFLYDATQVLATARIGFGFANPAGVVRIYNEPEE